MYHKMYYAVKKNECVVMKGFEEHLYSESDADIVCIVGSEETQMGSISSGTAIIYKDIVNKYDLGDNLIVVGSYYPIKLMTKGL